jgi:hypothetical protein
LRELRALRARAAASERLDEAVPAQDRMDRAVGGDVEIAVELAQQQLADLARAPMGLFVLAAQDEAFDLLGQLVGVAHRPPRSVGQRLEAMLLVAIEDFISRLARDAELPAHVAHRLAVEQTRDEPKTLFHNRTLLPGHSTSPARLAWREMSPMCPEQTVTHVSGRSHT